jgi:formamidopyrimidine-DNA glycosylase
MPELPEVEWAARRLRAWLGGGRIARAEVHDARILRGARPAAIARVVKGRRVKSIERRGKWMHLALDDGTALFSHLGMTGKWVKRAPRDPPERFERARLDGRRVSARYLDPRLFGRLFVVPSGGEPPTAWSELGPDPLRDRIDAKALAARFARTGRSIKEALLDQTVLAGVGNIQASEALFRARIDPRRPARTLEAKEVRALLRAIDASIAFTLGSFGPGDVMYVEEGETENPFLVYDKKGEPCPRCGTPIATIKQAGRTTFYCPRCLGDRIRRSKLRK